VPGGRHLFLAFESVGGGEVMTTVRIELEERWAWIVLNRPEKRNALNLQLMADLAQTFAELENREEVRVVLLTGEGKAFCSGLDLEALQQFSHRNFEESLIDSKRYASLLKAIYLFPKPVVAVLNGPAIAGGCGLVSVCDLALAAESAKLAYTEGRIGFVAAIVSYFLVHAVGEKVARELLLTARVVDAHEALRMGLVNEVVESSRLQARARELARHLCENSPQSMQGTKALLARIASSDLDSALNYACELNARSRSSADCIEGVAAFLEKRPPRWK
jgi:methylglutaconyl-CoA hydratase